ncbi:fibrinogen C domain-containing protein 1-like [Mytilus edulis]|uniref:fibrinogen C domain-containing protein 1-like n=1 Tax=Mytilus edulis TaxID=6550 RepID=UPI0039EEE121
MKTVENFFLVVCGMFVISVNAQLKRKNDFYANRPRDCTDIDIKQKNGVYKIYPKGSADGFNVYCDMSTESVNGGWTVFQRRYDSWVDFYRGWKDYKRGFGNVNYGHWLGNDRLHILTSQGKYELLITMTDFSQKTRYALYDKFKIGDEKSKYRLHIGTYSGNAGDSLTGHQGRKFSTKDQDNDAYSGNCAAMFKGAWWYNACHASNLNGLYLSGKHSSYANGMNWKSWKGHKYSLRSTGMMIRRLK